MNAKKCLQWALVAILGWSLGAVRAGGTDFSLWAMNMTIAAQSVSVDGKRDAKFEEYRDVADGFAFERFEARLADPDSPWILQLWGRDLGQGDERAGLRWGKAGLFSAGVSRDALPHLYSRGARLLHSYENGAFVLGPAVRAALEADPTLMPSILAASGQPFTVAVQRDTTKATLDWQLTPDWDLGVAARRVARQGNQRLSVGTYTRRQAITGLPTTGPNFFDRERFESRSIELPAPVDTTTDDLTFSTSFSHGKVFGSAGWERSSFDNDVTALRWDNPFEAAPGVASSIFGLTPGSEQEPAGSNQGNRGRFASAAVDLWPSNDAQRLNLSGGVELPRHTRLHLAYAAATMEQDDPFLRYTENEAILFALGADGIAGTADDVLARDVALPARGLDGKIETTRLDFRVTTRPIDALRLRAAYRSYEYDDKTRTLVFPGFASAGDSYFRPGIGQRDAAGVRVLFNEVGGYTKDSWSAGGAWRLSAAATLDVEYTSAEVEYDERQVDKTSEDTVAAKLFLTPGERFSARLTLLDASRDFSGAYRSGFETSRVRAFDVWRRDRSRLGVEADFEASQRWMLSFSYQAGKDEYPGVIAGTSAANPFPSQPYGLNEAKAASATLAATYTGKSFRSSFTLGQENEEWNSTATVKTSLAADSIQFDPVNRWFREQDDEILWASWNFQADLRPDKLRLTGDLWYSNFDGAWRTTNPQTPNVNSGVAYAVPETSSDLTSASLRLDWTVRKDLTVFARYLYEPYRLDDWRWDSLQPYMRGVITETGSNPSQIRAANVDRVLLLDSRYSDYTANVVAIGVKIKR